MERREIEPEDTGASLHRRHETWQPLGEAKKVIAPSGLWLCEACRYAVAGEDTGRWRVFCRLDSPMHAACAQADSNAVKELWEGAGHEFIFDRRGLPRDINVPLSMEGVSCSGWPPLAFAALPPQDKWPPEYQGLFQVVVS